MTCERSQLVVGLGQGDNGKKMREMIDRAAARAGKQPSVWAREVLLAAAGQPSLEARLEAVEERLDALALRLPGPKP